MIEIKVNMIVGDNPGKLLDDPPHLDHRAL
jgi:hypothetical protein